MVTVHPSTQKSSELLLKKNSVKLNDAYKCPDYVSRMPIIIVATHIKVNNDELNLEYSLNTLMFN